MENITIKINGLEVSAPKGSTILEAARLAHIEIPTLCFLKEINEIGACRICVVEVKGARSLVASCVYPINDGMEVWTNTPKVLESRRKTVKFSPASEAATANCSSCVRSWALRTRPTTTARRRLPASTTAPPTCSGTTPSVSCAAAA